MSIHETVRELARTCCVELFGSYDVELSGCEGSHEATIELAGIIGFTHSALKGAMIVGCSEAILQRSHRASTGASRRDWSAELANQLLGRVKNRLVARGVDVDMTTPIALRGQHLTVDDADDKIKVLSFHSSDGWVRVWIDLEVTGEIALTPEDATVAVATEGEMMLF